MVLELDLKSHNAVVIQLLIAGKQPIIYAWLKNTPQPLWSSSGTWRTVKFFRHIGCRCKRGGGGVGIWKVVGTDLSGLFQGTSQQRWDDCQTDSPRGQRPDDIRLLLSSVLSMLPVLFTPMGS